MVRVERYGKTITVDNPARPGERTRQTVVVFTEEGRPEDLTGVARSNAVLSGITGKNVGIRNLRTHSQPILEEDLHRFPVGSEHPTLFINRSMYSTPQVEAQRNVLARMVDGQPTFFLTELATAPEGDKDKRMNLETIAHLQPFTVLNARVRVANTVTEPVPTPPVETPVQHENLNQA